MNQVVVIPLGTGNERLLTLEALEALKNAKQLVLRTEQHPIVPFLQREGIAYTTLDDLYEVCEDFEVFYQAVAVRLMEMSEKAEVFYAVADPSVDASIMAFARLKMNHQSLKVLPGVSHAGRCMAMLGLQKPSVRIFAASEFRDARVTPEEALFLTEMHSRESAGDCKLKLLELMPPDMQISFFMGNEQGEMSLCAIPLCELDRQAGYDHMSACYISAVSMKDRSRFDMDDLLAIIKRLRGEGGCPWDREQTHETLLANLLEECYEFISAVREGDVDHIYDELGDVLLQVVFHAEIARQCGEFDILDVTSAISQKMIERHTHIFGTERADTAEAVLDNWEALKRKQRGITSTAEAMKDVSTGLSALLRAYKVQHKAAKVGFDFESAQDALAKIYEEADEVKAELGFSGSKQLEKELGDVLFSIVNVCRLCGKNPDIALFSATNEFVARFERMENAIKNTGKCLKDLTLSEMDVYWSAEKQVE